MPITDFLAKNAREHGGETALVEVFPEIVEKRAVTWKEYDLVQPNPAETGRREMTWGEFDTRANRFANLLLSRGFEKGSRVAILLMNCLEWLPIYFGTLRSGALAVPLNYRYTADEIEYCLRLAEADVLIFGPEFIGRVEQIADRIPGVKLTLFAGEDCPTFAESYDRLLPYFTPEAPNVPLTEDDDAAIYFSSGTTGFPKAILHAHRALTHAALCEQNHHGQGREDCFLCIPPLYHTGAKMHWFGSLVSCSKAVLLRGVSPKWILQTVSDERCTIVWLLVPWAQDILDALDRGDLDLNEYHLEQWRLMHIGAQPVPPSLIQRWLKVFPHHLYDTNYGLSESIGPGCVHLGVENVRKVGAIGVPGYGWTVRIETAEGGEAAAGEVGELCVKGPGVMKRYWNDPDATAAVLKDGWLYTGDMATRDEDGFIYLVDRKKDVIITGGENLYPVQIEDFLRAHPAIKDVAVIGLPDARLGEIAAAVVEVKPDAKLTEDELDRFCKGLPRYKRPRKYIFAEVPRNPTGKIEKPKLRERYCKVPVVKAQVNS